MKQEVLEDFAIELANLGITGETEITVPDIMVYHLKEKLIDQRIVSTVENITSPYPEFIFIPTTGHPIVFIGKEYKKIKGDAFKAEVLPVDDEVEE